MNLKSYLKAALWTGALKLKLTNQENVLNAAGGFIRIIKATVSAIFAKKHRRAFPNALKEPVPVDMWIRYSDNHIEYSRFVK